MTESRIVHVERRGRLAWVTLERPPNNLLDAELTEDLLSTLVSLDKDNATDAIALIGSGEVFCGGADGPKLRETGTARRFADAAVKLFGHFTRAHKPILAAINGDALAGGFGLLCSADIVVAADHVRVGTIEASLGTWPAIAQVPAARRVPPKAAITNCLTGVPFTARRAYELGIVDELTPRSQLRERVREYAELAVRGGAAARVGRPLFYETASLSTDKALAKGADTFVALFSR